MRTSKTKNERNTKYKRIGRGNILNGAAYLFDKSRISIAGIGKNNGRLKNIVMRLERKTKLEGDAGGKKCSCAKTR